MPVTIHPTALIGEGVTLADGVIVEAYAVVGKVPHRGYTARDPGDPQPTTIGAGTLIGVGAVIYAGATIGAGCLIGDGAQIREGVRLGGWVRLASHVTVNYDAVIGDETVVMQGTHVTGRMHLGARCFVGPLVVTMNHAEPRTGYDAAELAPPMVGNDVLIGGGAILAPGVVIGDDATIGAGAVVTSSVQSSGWVAAGGRR
jgi:acetyltransferase-like isoleucine patch superfamily enzyme